MGRGRYGMGKLDVIFVVDGVRESIGERFFFRVVVVFCKVIFSGYRFKSNGVIKVSYCYLVRVKFVVRGFVKRVFRCKVI